MIKHFEKNTVGRDFVVGDIHGCFTKLSTCLVEIGFDNKVDRLFSVGDLVDRGPESAEADVWVQYPWFHAVQGNHEDMAIRWPNGHMDSGNYTANGGAWNLARTKIEQVLTADAFRALPIAIEVETDKGLIGIVHAECPTPTWAAFKEMLLNKNLNRTQRDSLESCAMWNRERITSRNESVVPDVLMIIVGHTPLQEPVTLGNHMYIDTGAVFGRELTIVQIQ